MKLQPSAIVSRNGTSMISCPLAFSQSTMPGSVQSRQTAGQLRRDRHDHQVDVHVIFVEEGESGLPALGLEPALDLPGALLLGAGAAAADQHAAVLDDVEIAALESARGDHVVDWNAELLVSANGSVVLAATPPVRHCRDDRAVGRHDAGIAGDRPAWAVPARDEAK
jgi:surface antigen